LVSFDVWENHTTQMDVTPLKKTDCVSGGEDVTYPFLYCENQTKSTVLFGRGSVLIRQSKRNERDLTTLAGRLVNIGRHVYLNPFLVSFSIESERMVMFKDGRALINGTNDVDKAKTLYHRYLS